MSQPIHRQYGNCSYLSAIAENGGHWTLPLAQHAEYELALMEVLRRGEQRDDRTGTGTLSTFGVRMEFDLQQGFPLITTKKVFWKGVVEELLWFLRGEDNVGSLQEAGVKIWNEWADEEGNVGPIYGVQWRSWPTARVWRKEGGRTTLEERTVDQLMDVINQIRANPQSRRLLVSAWNVGDIENMALPPCHVMFQFYVRKGQYLDCQLYQRSGDMFLGVPFNIASYSLLTHIVADMTGLTPGRFIHTIGDAHIYLNHLDQVNEQLLREPRPFPKLYVHRETPAVDPSDYKREDFILAGYYPHPAIKGEVSV